jgi:isopentenyl-diphosphate delta-isomerase
MSCLSSLENTGGCPCPEVDALMARYPRRLLLPRAVAQTEEYVELVDACDRPLMVVPRRRVRRFGLIRRVVLVALRDAAERIYVQLRAGQCDILPGYWDLSATGHVRAGESREDAARRELEEEIGISATRLILRARHSPDEESTSFSTLYLAGPTSETPVPNLREVSDGMFLDQDELFALAEQMPVTPALRWALFSGHLFREKLPGGEGGG